MVLLGNCSDRAVTEALRQLREKNVGTTHAKTRQGEVRSHSKQSGSEGDTVSHR